jgi:hypothetical protein
MNGHFIGKLQLEYIDGLLWKQINPDDKNLFGFILDDGRSIIPENGSITDFASIPKIFQSILPPCGNGPKARYGFGAVIHDKLYRDGKIGLNKITQQETDDILKLCCESVGCEEWITHSIHGGLTVGGFVAWNEYRNKDKE